VIPDETVERVRESADIVAVIGEYVELKRQGTDYRGPCPFHQGTHRNFSVSPKKAMYYCFVCHEGGDVFNFLTKRLGVDWPTAVKMVAEKSGIEVVETQSRRAEQKDEREPLWEINGVAADYFRRMLWDDDLGRDARAYLEERGVSRQLADRVGLGFAPREIGLLRGYLTTLGFEEERMIAAGLVVVPDEGVEPRPRFRGRLMFPIYDVSSRVVGFGGRLLGPGEPKYLNSAESTIFSKGRLLYGLNWARQAARRDERMLVVEGYFDVVRLIGAGVDSVVAPMGTALTEEQAKLIRRYTARVFLLYDSDKAGLKATFRSGDELLRQGASVQVVTLPDGEDPDTFVRAHGARDLGQDGRGAGRRRPCVHVHREPRHSDEHRGRDRPQHQQRRRRIAAVGATERVDAVRNRLHAGEGGRSRRERAQHDERGDGADTARERMRSRRLWARSVGAAREADADEREDRRDEPVGREREQEPGLLHAAQVGNRDQQHAEQGQRQLVPAKRRSRRGEGEHTGGDGNRHRQDVVREQRRCCDEAR